MPPVGRLDAMSKPSRKDLEDEVLRLSDANRALKADLNAKNDKLKQLAGKLVKALSGRSGGDIGREEAEARAAELAKQNHLLKAKLQMAKSQLTSLSRMPLAPGGRHVPSRARSTPQPPVTPQAAHHQPQPPPQQHLTVVQPVASSQRVRELEAEVRELQRDKAMLQTELSSLPAANAASAASERAAVRENVEAIRLQRQMREKATELAHSQLRAGNLEQDLRKLKSAYDGVLGEVEGLSAELRSAQAKAAQADALLSSQQRTTSSSGFQSQLESDGLRREIENLRAANQELIANAFNTEREAGWAAQEKVYESRIRELESLIKADVQTRNDLLSQLGKAKAEEEGALSGQHRAEAEALKHRAEIERLQKQIQVLKTSGLSWSDSEGVYKTAPESETAQFLPSSQALQLTDAETALRRAEKAELTLLESERELEKTRNLLLAQYKINTESQAEVSSTQALMGEHKRRYEAHLRDFAEQLDQRALRIQRLEAQLKDIAHGRGRSPKVPELSPALKSEAAEAHDVPEAPLKAGENQLEVYLGKMTLSREATIAMGAGEPAIFFTLEFFDFQIQFTPVVQGPSAEVNYTCYYVGAMSELFLHCLATDGVWVEAHEARGSRYRSWAGGKIGLSGLLDSADGTLAGSLDLVGLPESLAPGKAFGSVAFAVHFRLPLQRSIAQHKERLRALGHVLANEGKDGTRTEETTQHLNVTVHRCRDLPLRDGEPPSAYVMYELWELAAHFTPVRHRSAAPDFDDAQSWPLPLSESLDHHLRTGFVRFLLFDDAAGSDEASLLGVVRIPLLALAHGQPIRGTYPIANEAGEQKGGWLNVSLAWKHDYVSPTGARELQLPEPRIQLPKEEAITVPDLHDDSTEHVGVEALRGPRGAYQPREERVIATDVVPQPQAPSPTPQPPARLSRQPTEPADSPSPVQPSAPPRIIEDSDEEETPKGSPKTDHHSSPPRVDEEDIEEIAMPPEPPSRERSFTIPSPSPKPELASVPEEQSTEGSGQSGGSGQAFGDTNVAKPSAPPRRVRITSEPEILGPKDEEEEEDEEEPTSPTVPVKPPSPTESSSEDELVMSSGLPSALSAASASPDDEAQIVLGIGKLRANQKASCVKSRSFQPLCELGSAVSVEAVLFNEIGQVVETQALPVPPAPGGLANFDFVYTIPMNAKRFDLLYKMLVQNKEVKFIMSTAPEDKRKAEDIAEAALKVKGIRDSGSNVLKRFLPLVSEDGIDYGQLEVTVKILAALEKAADN